MFSKTLFFIAFRHLFTRKRQTFLTVSGVAVGAMILITTLSMTEGLIDNIESTIIESSPHIVLKAKKVFPIKERLIENDFVNLTRRAKRPTLDKIRGYQNIDMSILSNKEIKATSPFIEVKGIIRYGTRFRPIITYGIYSAKEKKISKIPQNMNIGKWDDLSKKSNNVILGFFVAKKLGVKIGERLNFIDSEGKVWSLNVVGIFKSGLKNIDENISYLNFNFAQNIKNFPSDSASGINISLKDPKKSTLITQKISILSGYVAESWEEKNKTVLANFRQNNIVTLMLVIFTFIVSGFGISNVLNTVVLEKVKDIAVLKSIGFTKDKITMIFFIEGLVIGNLGAFLGAFLGWLLSTFLGTLPISFGEAAFIQSDHLNMIQKNWFYIITIIFSILISSVSAYSPSRKAAKFMPIEVFRGY